VVAPLLAEGLRHDVLDRECCGLEVDLFWVSEALLEPLADSAEPANMPLAVLPVSRPRVLWCW
jgi:hypothetical protein